MARPATSRRQAISAVDVLIRYRVLLYALVLVRCSRSGARINLLSSNPVAANSTINPLRSIFASIPGTAVNLDIVSCLAARSLGLAEGGIVSSEEQLLSSKLDG